MIAKIKVSEKTLAEAIRQEKQAGEYSFSVTPLFDYDYECFLVGGEAQAIMFLIGKLAALGENGLIKVDAA